MKHPGTPQRDHAIPTAITVSNLTISYGGRPVLRDVTLSIAANRVTAIMGPSGCGKSSLLYALNRMSDLLDGCRIAGSIHVLGKPVHVPETDVTSLRRQVGLIMQKPVPFPLSIRENIDLPLREHGVRSGDERTDRLRSVLHQTGLWSEVRDRLDDPAVSLSGGQQQRLCLARALALQPSILLMDEPCSALDPAAAETIERLICSLRGKTTVVVVTHNLQQARRIADDAVLFWVRDDAGQMVECGAAQQFFEAPKDPLTRAYINGHIG